MQASLTSRSTIEDRVPSDAACEKKIWGCVGELEVEDIVAARGRLLEQRIARKDQIMLTERSYGGIPRLLTLLTRAYPLASRDGHKPYCRLERTVL